MSSVINVFLFFLTIKKKKRYCHFMKELPTTAMIFTLVNLEALTARTNNAAEANS